MVLGQTLADDNGDVGWFLWRCLTRELRECVCSRNHMTQVRSNQAGNHNNLSISVARADSDKSLGIRGTTTPTLEPSGVDQRKIFPTLSAIPNSHFFIHSWATSRLLHLGS